MRKKKTVNTRAPGMTQISISLPSDLVAKIDELADAENRNRSNFIANQLSRFYESAEGRKLQQKLAQREASA
jgi:metal-responsive CopG/Arc/MetJ family transcriptional regulator